MSTNQPLNVTGSGITITDCGFSNWTAQDGMAIVSQQSLDIAGYEGVTLNAIGGQLQAMSLLANGDLFIRANQAAAPSGQNGSIEHTAEGGWKIDGKTLQELIREELCKILGCN